MGCGKQPDERYEPPGVWYVSLVRVDAQWGEGFEAKELSSAVRQR